MDISDRLRAVVPPISTPLLALYYLYLPLAIFLFGWVRPEFAIPLAILSGLLPIRICRKLKSAEFHFQRRKLLIAAGIILLWVILSGIGGYVWQNRWDHFFRNAVFNDLIQRPWPVADGNDILCYYLGYWLPPALLAKITGSSAIGNFAQLIYGFFGVLLAFRLIIEKIGNLRLSYLLPFIFFSGLDIIGFPLSDATLTSNLHIELWSELAAWESNTTLLFWVYNQAIPSWVATMLILCYGRHAGFCAVTLCFLSISAPFSVVGLFPLCVYYILDAARREKDPVSAFKAILSPVNIISIFGVIPVIAYLSLNSSTSIHIGFWGLSASQWTISLILLFVLEVLIFLPFIYREIAHSPEFYILFFTAAAALIFIMGDTSDFNSRIELPLNYYITFRLIVMVSKWRQLSLTTRRLFLGVAMLAAVTPILEISRTLYMTAREPAGEYISRREPSIFRFQLLRHNFVVDSLLINPTATIKIFNYNQDIKKPDHSKKE